MADIFDQVASGNTTKAAQPAAAPPSTQGGDIFDQVASGATTQPQPSNQPEHSFLRDITGSSADEWHQWNEEEKKKFLAHPIVSALKNIGSFSWGAAKAVDEFDPISIQRTKDL